MTKFIGIDNGVTGSVAILHDDGTVDYFPIPVKKELSYTKAKQHITRVDFPKLKELIEYNLTNYRLDEPVKCLIERLMVNPRRFKASASALRCLEAVLICLESLNVSIEYCDSKNWQKVLLPSGLHKEELKKASKDIAKRLFPKVETKDDGDALLIAEFCRRTGK